ncbi:hypothetical protein NDU88_005556 [Pleurodeles waltl]|uniref:Uncharacterized protein n=1 Tax=Pleurodeles waltl TaxID=8319 RepID=A0AAV7QHH7_PLEWA|nr:hypothetical protein NDU88_005556 [Pleurodeles waltl]
MACFPKVAWKAPKEQRVWQEKGKAKTSASPAASASIRTLPNGGGGCGEQPPRSPSALLSQGEEGARSSPQPRKHGRGGQEAGDGREAAARFQREWLSSNPEGGEGVEALTSQTGLQIQESKSRLGGRQAAEDWRETWVSPEALPLLEPTAFCEGRLCSLSIQRRGSFKEYFRVSLLVFPKLRWLSLTGASPVFLSVRWIAGGA